MKIKIIILFILSGAIVSGAFVCWKLAQREARLRHRQALVEKSLNAWRTPIEFYGKVLDENNNVVSGAQINFDCNDLSLAGTSYYQTKSDVSGLFSIKDIKGKILGVYVSKEGYYSYNPHGDNFEYGDSHITSVGKEQPVVFRLRKKGEGADLIHYNKSFRLPKDGAPVLIDLATGTVTASGENTLKVEGWTYDNQKKEGWKYDWKCRVSVPGGGLQIYDEQFPFLAPENNYAAEDVIDMPVTNGVSWSYIVKRNYFVRTSEGKFSRIVFTMVAGGDNFCELNLFFNSERSRNLEPAK